MRTLFFNLTIAYSKKDVNSTTTVELVGLLKRGNPTLFQRSQKYWNMHIVLETKRMRLLLKFS